MLRFMLDALRSSGKTQTRQQRNRTIELLESRSVMAADPFSLVVLPDTQYYAESYPAIFLTQTNWITQNIQNEKIAFVSHLGDIVDNGARGTTRNAVEWQRADSSIDRLDGNLGINADGLIPYSVTLGNHDYDVVSDKTSGTTRYQENFGPARYESRSWYTEDSGTPGNHAQYFMAGGYRFLHITLQYEPLDSDIAWAQKVIDQNPGLPTIFSTHSYLNPTTKARQATIQGRAGTTVNPGNTGEQVWQKLIRVNPQIFLVMNGHFSGEYHQTSTNAAGQPVFEIVSDYQSRANGGDGWLRMMKFDTTNGRIDIKTFSPTRNEFETDANSQFTLNLDFQARFGAPLPTGYQVSQFQNGRVVGTQIYQGAIDTQLRQASPTTNYNTNTTALLVDASSTGQNNTSQTLLQFTNIIGNGAGQIPAGAKILNAKLVVDSTNPGAGAKLHRLLKPWTGNETWNTWGNGVQANGTEATTNYTAQVGLSARTPVAPVNADLTINVTADLQAWVNGTANHGWAMLPWTNGTDGWAFTPSEAAKIGQRPSLQVEWVMPTATVSNFQNGTNGYTGTQDTMIRVNAPTTAQGAAGVLWVDGPTSNQTAQTLIRFNNLFGTGAGQIPAGAVIESARLYLTTPYTDANSPGGGASLHRMVQNWSNTTTWSNSFGGNGIDRNNTEARTQSDRQTGSVQQGSVGFDVTNSLTAWQNGAANNGWLLQYNNSNGWAISSSENEVVNDRPRLVVVWSMPSAARLTNSVASRASAATVDLAWAALWSNWDSSNTNRTRSAAKN